MKKRVWGRWVAVWMMAACVYAQKPTAGPSFEVATIKPSAPGQSGRSVGWEGRHFLAHDATISQVMQLAYGVQEKQILGAPEWFDTATYDLDVVADGGEPTREEWKAILRQMLAERLKLQSHHEQKVMPAYVLSVAKGGPKLSPPKDEPGVVAFGVRIQRGPKQWMRIVSVRGSMTELAAELQRVETDRPVVDQTGLTGRFNFELTATSTRAFFAGETPDTSDNAPPALFTAMQEQLGLKLEPAKTAVDCVVLDHVERPSAN